MSIAISYHDNAFVSVNHLHANGVGDTAAAFHLPNSAEQDRNGRVPDIWIFALRDPKYEVAKTYVVELRAMWSILQHPFCLDPGN
jgi:hypothetical protein